MRPKVSIVMATYQRKHLLERSLQGYERQVFNNDKLEMVVIDDHSTDGTAEMVRLWGKRTGISTVVVIPPKDRQWRDCGAVLNYGIRVSRGTHVLLTHPEVIPGIHSVRDCVNTLDEYEGLKQYTYGVYVCCPIYYLSQREQACLNDISLHSSNLAVRDIPDFYANDSNGNPDYSHTATDNIGKPGFHLQQWESWVFGGCSGRTWKMLGGMIPTQKWGSVDILWLARRRTLGIPTVTMRNPESICIHQDHSGPNDVPTPRIEEVWKQELQGMNLSNPLQLVYPSVDEL